MMTMGTNTNTPNNMMLKVMWLDAASKIFIPYPRETEDFSM